MVAALRRMADAAASFRADITFDGPRGDSAFGASSWGDDLAMAGLIERALGSASAFFVSYVLTCKEQ